MAHSTIRFRGATSAGDHMWCVVRNAYTYNPIRSVVATRAGLRNIRLRRLYGSDVHDCCPPFRSSLQVWKRYSRFLDLRSELSDKVPPVKDLPFPKKKLKKKKDSVRKACCSRVGFCLASRMPSCCKPLRMPQPLKKCTCGTRAGCRRTAYRIATVLAAAHAGRSSDGHAWLARRCGQGSLHISYRRV